MRPRRLRVKGYTAFVEEADLDFDGLDLFAITGPTGAGKTSLLQAMTIALYGRAPKLGDDLRQLISPFGEQARFYFRGVIDTINVDTDSLLHMSYLVFDDEIL